MTGGEGLILHEGILDDAFGAERVFLVEKICRNHPDGSAPDSWLYWRREALAYASGLLAQNAAGIRTPKCFGVTFDDEVAAHIFIEALDDAKPYWSLSTYRDAAFRLGQFNVATLGWPDATPYTWMAQGRCHSWAQECAPILADWAKFAADPVIQEILPGKTMARCMDLWANAPRLFDALAVLPTCFCHHDAFRRNLIYTGSNELVAIDWAFSGPGVLGEELAALFGATLQFREFALEDATELREAILEGYIEGQASAGWTGNPDEVRFAFAATTGLMFGPAMFGPWLKLLTRREFEPVLQSIVGCDQRQFIKHLAATMPVFLDLGEEAIRLLDRI